MPVHNWGRVKAGIFHDFHTGWIAELRTALNNGILPPDFYALAEQFMGKANPDVITLQTDDSSDEPPLRGSQGALTVKLAPPKVRFTATAESDYYLQKQRMIAIRHSSNDRIVALIEIVSPGNKSSRRDLRKFVKKAADALARGYHLLLIDLHPPGKRDPQGIHGVLWSEICDDSYVAPPDKPLTLAAYTADEVNKAYVEPVAVGDTLPDMPLFLDPETYVLVPLEATYLAAYRGVPRRWRDVLETPSS